MNAVEIEEAFPARAEKGSGHHGGLDSTEAIGTLLHPANGSVTDFPPSSTTASHPA